MRISSELFQEMLNRSISVSAKLRHSSADMTSRPRLRSTNSQRYERQRTSLKFGQHSFSCDDPRAGKLLSLAKSLEQSAVITAQTRQKRIFHIDYNSLAALQD